MLLRALTSWGWGNYATLLPCTSLPYVNAQQITLEPRGTLLQTATLSFVLEVGGFSFPMGKGDLHECYAPVLPSLVPS